MKRLIMTLRGTPKGWERSGQNGKFHYDTKKNTEMKAVIRVLAQTEAEKQNIQLPIPAGIYGYEITIRSFFVPPKSTTKKKLALIDRRLCNPTCKPDADNIGKLWLDALVKGGIIEDDKNVVSLTVEKRYWKAELTACDIRWIPDSEVENG